jgi:hypothetical protein
MHGIPAEDPDSPFYVFLHVRRQITENIAAVRRLRSEAFERLAITREAIRRTDVQLARGRALGLWCDPDSDDQGGRDRTLLSAISPM